MGAFLLYVKIFNSYGTVNTSRNSAKFNRNLLKIIKIVLDIEVKV